MASPRPPLIDAHHHIWWLDRTPWLNGPEVPRIFGSYGPLRRDYLISEYANDVKPTGVVKSVYVQINVERGNEVAEVGWATQAGATMGLIQGVVAFADLASSTLAATLDKQQEFGTLRGIRHQLHWHENSAYRFAPRADLMLDNAWQKGLACISDRGLLFELQVFPDQFRQATQLVEKFPGTTFVLLHAGMLEDRSIDGWAKWRAGMATLAKHPNVYVKLSGLGTFSHSCNVETWLPVIDATVELFGPSRCMFGSNFPIEKLWTSYSQLVDVFDECIAGFSATEQHLIRYEVANHLYQL